MKFFKWFYGILGALILLFSTLFLPPFFRSDQNVDIPIYSKTSAREIAQELKDNGIIEFALPFRVLTKLTHADRRLKAGLYRFNPRMSLWSVLTTLTMGKSELPLLKVPEGYTAYQIAQELEKLKVTTAAGFLAAVSDKTSLQGLRIEGPSAEGFLFPETYRVPVGAGAGAIVDLMVHQFDQEVGEDFQAGCRKQGMTPYQAVILASIVEKEAKLSDERPIIAGVLYNRLHQKMRLQVNATVNYVLNSKNPWFTTDQLGTKTPYNTYLHRGLPPTPICNPGLESLEAVLEPADVPYLYYVAQGDGSHLFATTFAEHQKNIRLAKRILRQKKLEASEASNP